MQTKLKGFNELLLWRKDNRMLSHPSIHPSINLFETALHLVDARQTA